MEDMFQQQSNEFRALLAAETVDLARSALVIARLEYPDLQPEPTILRLDAFAASIKERLSPRTRLEDRLAAINRYLFAEQKFRGNDADFQDPRNSCLNAVLERKTGIPITLSLVYMEIGRRLGMTIDGVAFPGHFLIRVPCKEGLIVLDPYNGGMTLGDGEVRERLRQIHGPIYAEKVLLADILKPATPREFLLRMLRNLKQIYREAGETDKAIAAISLALIADPNAASEWRDRGLLYREIEAYRAALGDLARYLELEPDAVDRVAIRQMLMELYAINARLN